MTTPSPRREAPAAPKRTIANCTAERLRTREVYEAAADAERYRVADAPMFACAAHREAVVLCATAGKVGRRGGAAAVGATLFWLTCPHLNILVARLERSSAVRAATQMLADSEAARRRHTESHEHYTRRARELLSESQWEFFRTHIAECAETASRKYGNAAVGHPEDVKCLHALLAQFLSGAGGCLGEVVANFIVFLSEQVGRCCEGAEVLPAATGETEAPSDSRCGCSDDVLVAAHNANTDLRLRVDDGALFTAFLRETNDLDPPSELHLEGFAPYPWLATREEVQSLSPDLCQRAYRVLVFLEGKPPRIVRKRRLN